MTKTVQAICLSWLLLLLGTVVLGQTVRDLSFREAIWGEKILPGDIEERVLVIILWSVNSGPCRSTIYEMNSFYKKYTREGILVTSIHDNSVPSDIIWKYAKQNSLVFPIYKGTLGDVGEIKDLPRFLVFNHEGKIEHNLPPREAIKKIQEIMRKSPHWLIGKEIKRLKSEASRMVGLCKEGGNFTSLYKQLKKKQESGDDSEKEEAEYLLGRLNKFLGTQKNKLKDLFSIDPMDYVQAARQFEKHFKGLEDASEAIQEYSKFVSAPDFKKWQAASKIWKALVEMQYTLKPARADEPVNLMDPKCLKKNISALTQMYSMVQTLQKRYPETSYAKKAEELAGPFLKFLDRVPK